MKIWFHPQRFYQLTLLILLTFFAAFAQGKEDCSAILLNRLPPYGASKALNAIFDSANSISTRDLGMKRSEMIEFIKADPRYLWIADDLLNDRLAFAMNRNETSRLGIATNGFQNMFEAKRSATGMRPEERILFEAAMVGMTKKSYQNEITDVQRPLYLYLAPPIGSKRKRESNVQNYGTDTYIFRKDRVSDIVTWTFGDSIDREFEFNSRGDLLSIPKLQRFLPWKDRDLMLPRLARSAQNPKELALQDMSSWITLPNGNKKRYGPSSNESYIEIELWRKEFQKITLDDVEAFIFTKNPPSGLHLAELRRRGIAIYYNDGKKEKLWTDDLNN